jgi:hypothetical protein
MIARTGLDGTPGSISFESVNFPGYYLRHAGYTCQLNKKDGSNLFNLDASFNQITTPEDSIKLQSVNFPDYLLTHDNQRVRISRFNNALTDNSLTYAQWRPTKK